MFSVPAKSRRPMVAPTNLFFIATTPSLRDTSPQGEAFRLPLRGAVGNADWGVACYLLSLLYTCHLSALRTSLLKEKLFGSTWGEPVGNADWGVACYLLSFLYTCHHSVTSGISPQEEAFRLPLRRACRQRRLRGGISHRKNYIHNFITFHPHCQATNITLTLRFA